MRIIGGQFKGSGLYIPESKDTRPLKDLVRESIFNLLFHSKKFIFEIENSNILDLYAGSGSFGLECLSRSAKFVCFVESKQLTFETLEKNIEKLRIKKKTQTIFYDVFKAIERDGIINTNFDLIFLDPPYINKDIEKLIEIIFKKNLLKKNGIIILHRKKDLKEKYPNYFNILDERIYGISKIIFGKLST
tara:strand:- start:358 stop:927 length:570 start_codon:yes stop_codon:yes gene_type:complete